MQFNPSHATNEISCSETPYTYALNDCWCLTGNTETN